MDKSSSASARALAATALVCGVLVLVVVVVSSLSDGSGSGNGGSSHSGVVGKKRKKPTEAPASYVVKAGDTLISIAHRTGVSVAEIQRLNPGVDPQILVSGEELKLK
jgi:LysM repeat protein